MSGQVSEPDASWAPAVRARPPRRTKTAMVVAQRIVEEISSRDYGPGTKLPPEREMLAKYEVGRGTLRESLRFLEMNGVVTVKPGPGGGPIVAMPDAQDLAGTLGLFLELHGTEFGAILQVREVLEPAIAGLTAERNDEKVVEALGESVEAMQANLADLDQFLLENERFHHLVAAGAGNPIFSLLIGSLNHIADGTRVGVNFPPSRRKAVATAHSDIYDAIRKADREAAAAEMARHVEAFRRYTEKHHATAITSPLRWRDVAP